MPSTTFKNTCFKRHAKKYRSYYLNRFISHKCAVDMLELGLFPNAKEVTESYAAYEAMCNHIDDNFRRQDDYEFFCIGDGHKPRTAATFCFRSKCSASSIDPLVNFVNLKQGDLRIKRLTVFKERIENLRLTSEKTAVIVCVHSHAKMAACLKAIQAPKRHIISIPCCYQDNIGEPDISYTDENIWSDMNKVNIYLDR